MSALDWLVLLGGLAAIVWVNWYFLWAGKTTAVAAQIVGETQQIQVRVEGGYEPAVIRVQRDRPVRLVFDRQETSGCSEEIVLPEFGIRKFLPPFQQTAVEFVPHEAGRFEFTCGMAMLRGTLIVE